MYRCIDAGLLKLDNMVLPKKLRCRVKGDKNAHKRKNKKRYGDSIELRPAAVNDRTGVGHGVIPSDNVANRKTIKQRID